MSSILTNNSAMVALQTLKGINSNLAKTQNEISTGKSVATAKDNASIWAISKVMESDVKGFKAISESLSLGQSTVAVARNASETVTDLLTDIKGKIVAAQEDNVDRDKIQTDIDALTDQINSVVGAAQFNGLNLLQGSDAVNVLSSLDRDSAGGVTSSNISVDRNDLGVSAGTYGNGSSLTGGAAVTAADAAATGGNISIQAGAGQNFDGSSTRDFSNSGNSLTVTFATAGVAGEQFTLDIGGTSVSFTAENTVVDDYASGISNAINAAEIEGITASVAAGVVTITSTNKFDDLNITGTTTSGTTTLTAASEGGSGTVVGNGFSGATLEARASEITFDGGAAVAEGDGYRVTIAGTNVDYVAGAGETMEDVAKGLKIAIDSAGITGVTANFYQDSSTSDWVLQLDNNAAAKSLAADAAAKGTTGVATGGLYGLSEIDVTTDQSLEAALSNVETFIDTAIEAAASFGSSQSRIDTQSQFISKLTDTLKSGIGSLVDADMEEASARLQALQVQQQLGIQSLSIANQAPQSVLSLFR